MRPGGVLLIARQLAGCLAVCLMAIVCSALMFGCDRMKEMLPSGTPTTKISPQKSGTDHPADARPSVQDAPPSPSTGARGIPPIPRDALKHRADLTRNARSVWGLDAPVAVFAAQVHQESGWREAARSPVGAQGMAQFMPATAEWISQAYPELRANQPLSPAWALRALVIYDRHLWERIVAASDCHRMAFALSAYNGGLGWVQRDRKVAADKGLPPGEWWASVETVNAGRSSANWKENRGYPQRILHKLAPVYAAAGWGQGICQEVWQ